MFKTAQFEDRDFKPLSIAVIAVSDTRTLETDTGGALLKCPGGPRRSRR